MTTSYRNEISKRTIRNAPQSGKHHGEGPSDGAQRNARVASFVAARKAARENDKEKKIADRTAAAEKRKKETLAMATEENSGTEARTKIKNVSRPDDPAPDSKDSKLVKTGEIKTKKIDEGRSMSINRNFGLPESLIAATRELLEKRNEPANNVGKGKTVVDTDPETNDRDVNDEVTEKKGKKKLDPVGKENDDIDNDGDVDKSDKYLHHRRKAIGKAMKEEAEQIDEVFYTVRGHGTNSIVGSPTKFIGSAISKALDHTKAGRKVTVKSHDHENGHIDSVTINPGDHVKRAIEGLKKVREPVKEDVEQIDELKHNGILSRYIKAVRPDVDDDVASPKRKAGYHMALKKKWGDKKYGFDEPRVKATNEEFSDAELARIKEIAAKFDDIQESPATERGLQDHEPRIVSGVKGMKSKSFSKKFPHAKAMEKWMDSDDYGNHEVHRIEKA